MNKTNQEDRSSKEKNSQKTPTANPSIAATMTMMVIPPGREVIARNAVIPVGLEKALREDGDVSRM